MIIKVAIIHQVSEPTNLCVFLNFSHALTLHIQSATISVNPDSKNVLIPTSPPY